jgi:hypothetical protein
MLHKKSLTRIRMWLRWLVGLAGLISVGINMLHANLNGNTVSVLLSSLPPAVVIASAEIISRTPGDPKWPWHKKWIRPVVMILLAGGGAWLSYWAQAGAIMYYTNGNWQEAHILPLLVDGFMVIMSFTVYLLNERLMAIDLVDRSREAKAQTPETRRRSKDITAKERVAALLNMDPYMKAPDIAKKVGISPGYAATLRSELKRAGDAELDGALVS